MLSRTILVAVFPLLGAFALGQTTPAEAPSLRALVDEQCDAGDCGRASEALRQLLPGTSDEFVAAVVRALSAAEARDVKGMLREVESFPSAAADARQEALILVSRRAAVRNGELKGSFHPDKRRKVVWPESLHSNVTTPPPPGQARATEGKVILQALILPTGEAVAGGTISATNPSCIAAAAEVVARWRYTPGTIDGVPSTLPYLVRVDFKNRR